MLIAYKVPREEYKLLFKDSKMYNRFLNYIKTTHFSDWEDLYNRLDIRIVRDDKDKSIKYPIDEILYFDEEPGSFSLENNAIIWSNYDYGDKFWHYSIDLLKINSHNFQELLINPVYRLLHEEPLQIVPNSALDNALIRYENLESIIK